MQCVEWLLISSVCCNLLQIPLAKGVFHGADSVMSALNTVKTSNKYGRGHMRDCCEISREFANDQLID